MIAAERKMPVVADKDISTISLEMRVARAVTAEDLTKPPLSLDVSGSYDWNTQTRTKPDSLFPVATAQTSYSTATGNGWDNQTDLDQNF